MDVWEHRRHHPEDNEAFDAAMRTLSRTYIPAVLGAHDFGRHRVVADVGGGTGAVIAEVLAAHPAVRGILFDQHHVVACAGPVLSGVMDRVSVVAGNFFDEVPVGADAYLLCRVLHDWADEDARAILGRVREAMEPDGCLLIFDAVVGPPNEDPLTKFLDLMMLVSAGGCERTETEWVALLAAGGFRFERATRATANGHVLEAVPS